MKRGFLLKQTRKEKTDVPRNQLKKADPVLPATSARKVETSALPDDQIIAFDLKPRNDFGPAFDVCAARIKQLPTPTPSSISPSALICTRMPPNVNDAFSTTECILYSRTKRHFVYSPKFPRQLNPTIHPVSYDIRNTKSTGYGMFATRPLKVGDLILIERPLMVLPINTDLSGVDECPELFRNVLKQVQGSKATPMGIMEPMLEVAFGRMTKENQEAFLALANAHTNDGTTRLSAIWRTNTFAISDIGELGDENDQYGMVLKEMSRINHSCRPNCTYSFDTASFSFELRVSRAIAQGEEIFFCYCEPNVPTVQRQAELKPYGFSCTCLSCCPTSPNPRGDIIRSTIAFRVNTLQEGFPVEKSTDSKLARKAYDDSLSILHDLEQEGLAGDAWYRSVMDIHVITCMSLDITERFYSRTGNMRWSKELSAAQEVAKKLSLAHDGSFRQ
ncbi:hypothetical protein BDQ17DRAFT_1430141 [Cyathus striatus]|nr:hypothetical protein BDQ17DRAFT_1430141 [Cyathus striatus]